MEHDLPVNRMLAADHADIYVEAKGRWVDGDDVKVAGFSIAETLEKNYGRIEMESVQREDGKMVLVPKSRTPPAIRNWFHSNDLYSQLKGLVMQCEAREYVELDPNSRHIFAFDEPLCFDFRRAESLAVLEAYIQGVPESDEKVRLRKVYAPLRPLVMEDYNSHYAPHKFQLYDNWRDGLVLMDLLQPVSYTHLTLPTKA